MKRFYFLILPIIVLMITGTCWGSAHAQDTQGIQINTLEVQLLPEYEGDSMLVIWNIELSEDTSLPRELMVKIPADAEIQSISLSNQDAGQIAAEAEEGAITIGEWQNVRFTTSSPEIQIEYFDPNLIEENNQRKFDFKWFSTYPVSAILINVYQPLGISEIITMPALPAATEATATITQYSGELGAISPSEIFSFELSYAGKTDTPSYPKLDVISATPIDKTTTGRSAIPLSVVIWLLALAVSILIIVGLNYWWFRKNNMEKRTRTYHSVGIMNPEKGVTYCYECGMRSQSGDSYCRNCGTPLQQSNQRILPAQT